MSQIKYAKCLTMEFFWSNLYKRVHERQSTYGTYGRWQGCRISTLLYGRSSNEFKRYNCTCKTGIQTSRY